MDGTSLLGAGEITELRQLVRDGLRTELEFSDTNFAAILLAPDPLTGDLEEVPGGPWEAVVRYAGGQANELTADQAAASSATQGIIEAFVPFPAAIGQSLRLPNGSLAYIVAPEPREEFGIVTANWRTEEGTP